MLAVKSMDVRDDFINFMAFVDSMESDKEDRNSYDDDDKY